MKKTHLAISMLLIIAALFNMTAVQATNSVIEKRTLLAGQYIEVGTLTVAFDDANLIITFETIDGWKLYETHLYLSKDRPTKSAPGRFPYKHESLPRVTFDQYIISLDDLNAESGETLFIAAHAVVCKCGCGCETAWAYGCYGFVNRGGRTQGWAMYGDVVIP